MSALDPQVHRPCAERDEGAVQRFGDAGEHVQAEILVTTFDPVHGALTRCQRVGELGLREICLGRHAR